MVGADGSPAGGREEARIACALGSRAVCRAPPGAHSLMGEAGANQMAVLWKPGLHTEASALEGGQE